MKKIALAQMNVVYGNFDRNVLIAELFIDKAILSNCDLILFPELWSTGFDLHHLEDYSFQNRELLNRFQNLADKSNITICGTYAEKQNDHFFNSFKVLQPNQPAKQYHKMHLFQLMHEDNYFTPGLESTSFNSVLGNTGLGICFDLRFPDFFWHLSKDGVESFLLSAHWPLARIHHWEVLLQARAIENQAYVVAVNSVGHSGNDIYGGHSMVIAPDGEILLNASSTEENLYITEIEPENVKKYREKFIIQR